MRFVAFSKEFKHNFFCADVRITLSWTSDIWCIKVRQSVNLQSLIMLMIICSCEVFHGYRLYQWPNVCRILVIRGLISELIYRNYNAYGLHFYVIRAAVMTQLTNFVSSTFQFFCVRILCSYLAMLGFHFLPFIHYMPSFTGMWWVRLMNFVLTVTYIQCTITIINHYMKITQNHHDNNKIAKKITAQDHWACI